MIIGSLGWFNIPVVKPVLCRASLVSRSYQSLVQPKSPNFTSSLLHLDRINTLPSSPVHMPCRLVISYPVLETDSQRTLNDRRFVQLFVSSSLNFQPFPPLRFSGSLSELLAYVSILSYLAKSRF